MAIRIILEDNRNCSDHELLHNIWTHLQLIHEQNQQIMATQAELAQQINQIGQQVGKIKTESEATLTKVNELQDIINNQGGVSPELQSAVDALKAQVQVVDDLVADTPAPDTGNGGNTGEVGGNALT